LNEGCRDCYEGFEALVRLAGAHGYPSVFFEFAEVVFDQMPPFVGFPVELCGERPVRFWWDDRDDAAFYQVRAQPIRIKSPVCQKMSGGQAADQRLGLA
jgi:hypothetical protein